MSEIHPGSPLSRVELVVLARLSQARRPSGEDLASAVRELCLPDEGAERARAAALEAVERLHRRGLVGKDRWQLTGEGTRTLRTAFRVRRAPSWRAARDRILPMLALGIDPCADGSAEIVQRRDRLAAAVLRWKFGLGEAATSKAVCDALICEALGLPDGPVTLERIRAHVLARRLGVDAAGSSSAQLAAHAAADAVQARGGDRRALAEGLGRRWLRGERDPRTLGSGARREPPPLRVISGQAARQDATAATVTATSPTGATGATSSATPAGATGATPGDRLLAVVREALPQVGAEGRFGSEKVFVSALWQRIEQRGRVAAPSLDDFKRWLVTANRDGALVLARADVVGAMNARLVAESEIRDRGATFHFVLDARLGSSASQGDSHVR